LARLTPHAKRGGRLLQQQWGWRRE
jgi:hypothetical protein